MSRFGSARKAIGMFLLRDSNSKSLLTGQSRRGIQVGSMFTQYRCFSSIAGIESPCLEKLIGNDERFSNLLGRKNRNVQLRQFLSCGDGEEGDSLSKTYEERRVLGYHPEQLFAVVAAVDLYEDFVPWCQGSRIIRHDPDGTFDAELQIGFKFLTESYVSHVELNKPRSIKTTVTESNLFDHLINIWEFNPGPMPGTCDLRFLVDFKFQSPLYRQVASMFFKEVVGKLGDSFSDRCRVIYGPGLQVLENSYGEQRV
ncbi:hypothetical protein Syun_001581 [Stephania yunnanensis]|uniref:Coenzyme Q-binding protein COQ10 START domain-containing protein n=1 Tax=Stephania yunnanensis TaxID=152371 RepID=A0AAP0LED7_9MAGN